MAYVAVVNTPGYLPESMPIVFETAREAWEYLAGELEHDSDIWDRGEGATRAARMIQECIADPDGPLTGIWSHDDNDPHDLGLVYSVQWSEEEEVEEAI